MIIDIIFVVVVLGLLLAIYKLKFKKNESRNNSQRPIFIDVPR